MWDLNLEMFFGVIFGKEERWKRALVEIVFLAEMNLRFLVMHLQI